MAKDPIFFARGDSPKMIEAFKKAQETFKYFWRELSWEYRRVIPGLGVACAKVAFSQTMPGEEEPTVEHMWVNEVEFDGETIRGVLVNQPNSLTNIANGDRVEVPLSQLSDWLFSSGGTTCGGFTIQAMRSEMSSKERQAHDKAWGLDFGDFNEVLVVREQKEKPENLEEHPMSKNMGEKLIEYMKENPGVAEAKDKEGYTILHREAIAGNRTSVEILKQYGADLNAKTNKGKTALDFATQLEWEHLIPLLK